MTSHPPRFPGRSTSGFVVVLAASIGFANASQAEVARAQYVPSECADHVAEAAMVSGLPSAWIVEVMRAESSGRVRAVSPAGALGCMQIMPGTWAELTHKHALGSDPFDPRANMLGGALYLRTMYDQFGWPGALAGYHAGPGGYADYIAGVRPLPNPTLEYVDRVTGQLARNPPRIYAAAEGVVPVHWSRSALFTSASDPLDETTAAISVDPKGAAGQAYPAMANVTPTPGATAAPNVELDPIAPVHPIFAVEQP